jgi:hypothetical protein
MTKLLRLTSEQLTTVLMALFEKHREGMERWRRERDRPQ